MPLTSSKRFGRFKDYLKETDILEMLPFGDNIQDGQVTQGVYIVHHPVWMIYILAALMIIVMILVGVIWSRTDKVVELLIPSSVVVSFTSVSLLGPGRGRSTAQRRPWASVDFTCRSLRMGEIQEMVKETLFRERVGEIAERLRRRIERCSCLYER